MFSEEEREEIRRGKEDWMEMDVEPTVESYGTRKESYVTDSGIQVNELYTPDDLGSHDYLDDEGFPGREPFTRGVYPNMYRGKLWTMRQYAGFGTAEETNERYRYLLDKGQTGLSVAFDLPTQMGRDSDDPLSEGEVGKAGVAIDSLRDFEKLFDGIPLNEVSTSMTINAPASVLLAMYVAVGDKQGVDRSELRGTVQNDVLKEYIARNTYIYPPEPSMRLVTDVFEFCNDEVPRWNTISISGYHIREAGSTAVQEVAFTLADAVEYVEAALDGGMEVDEFAPRLSFFFNSHNRLFEEVAKFRAARRIWCRLMDGRFGAESRKSKMLRFHTQTAGSSLTAQQIENNVVRVAYQALAGVLGGTQSLHTNGKDEALSLPTEESARTALRTQQILAHETGVADTVDPLAGSYYVESLTDDIEERVWSYLDEIEERGGMLPCIESGWVQREIQETAYEKQREVESGERTVVGVNRFAEDDDMVEEVHEVNESERRKQVEDLEKVKNERDAGQVNETLEDLRTAAEGDENLMPYIVEAVKAYATVGEICNVMRDVFGEYEGERR
ncbi:MAG: methylmalonyl-CoA mutase [Halobacteria archaeon]